MIETSWKNAQGQDLYAVHWAVNEPIAVIALVHGQGEHIGRYPHLAAWYNARKVAVIGFDQQGYGRSEGGRGHADNLEVLLDDIGLLLEKTRAAYPHTPLFLYGHSMGGNLVLNYTLRREAAFSGLIATSPWIRLAFEAPTLKVLAGKVLRRFMPALSLPTGLAAHFISRDPVVVSAYKNDPLVHSRLSAAAGISLMEAAAWLNAYSGPMPVRTLLQHGTGDRIISPAATREFAQRVTGDVMHVEWPGGYHELHNEPEKLAFFERTLLWMRDEV